MDGNFVPAMNRSAAHVPSEPDAPAPGGSPRPPGRRSAHHILLFGGIKRHKRAVWMIAAALLALAVAAFLVWRHTDLTWASVTDMIDRIDPIAALPLMAILPIFGFPIAVVYLFAGARFGPVMGGAVVAGVTAVHLLGTYLIARSFVRRPLERWIERKHQHLPQVPPDEQAGVAVVATLVPGLPYFVRNYVLALAGVRLSVYFWVCLPIYVARSYVTILLGDMSSDPSRAKLFILLAVDAVKVAICAIVIWRLRVHHRKYHGHHENDHPAPAGA